MAQRDNRRVIIAANPSAGARATESPVAQLASAITSAGMDAHVETNLDLLADVVAIDHQAGALRAVIAAGGDGTAAAVINLIDSDVPLIPYPLGTENLLARYLGIRANPEQICELLNTGVPLKLDAGRANGRLFLLLASCGIDADVVRRVQEQRRGHIVHLTYVRPTLSSLQQYTYPDVRAIPLDENGQPIGSAISGKWALVINVPRYAGGLQIVREASGTDGLLDICVFKKGSIFHHLRYFAGVLFRRHQSWSDCHVQQAHRVRIESDEPVPYQLDGDFGGHLPLEIEVLPQRVTLVVDPTLALLPAAD